MVIGGNGKRFSIRALEFRVISATIKLQQMKSVYKVVICCSPGRGCRQCRGIFKLLLIRSLAK